jgi:hypothetical protein
MAQLVGVVGDQMPNGRRAPRPLAHGSDTSATIEHHKGRSGARERGGRSRWRVPTWRSIGRAGRADALGNAPVAARDRCTGKDPTRSRDGRPGPASSRYTPAANKRWSPFERQRRPKVGELPPADHLHLPGYELLGDRSRPATLAGWATAREWRMTVLVNPGSAARLAAAGAGGERAVRPRPSDPARGRGARCPVR